MTEIISGEFVHGEKGLICRRPSDRGAWIVPARGQKDPEIGVNYVLEIIGASRAGNLRFALVVEKFSDYLKRGEKKRQNERMERRDRIAKKLRDPDMFRPQNDRVTVKGEPYENGEERLLFFDEETGFEDQWDRKGGEPHIFITKEEVPEAVAAVQQKEKEKKEERVMEKQRLEELRIEREKKEADFIGKFFLAYPDSRSWFDQMVTQELIEKAAIERGLATFVREYEGRGYSSFSKGWKTFVRVWSLQLGNEVVTFTTSYEVEEYGDD